MIIAKRTKLTTSRHEAAHAVVAHKCGARVLRLSMKPNPKGAMLGGCEIDGRCVRNIGPFTMTLMLMAGSCADNHFGSERIGVVSADDFQVLKHMGCRRELRTIHALTLWLVKRWRKDIERVALALRKKYPETLGGAELQRLLGKRGQGNWR